MKEVLTQHKKVILVIRSCKTAEQLDNAHRWALGWAKRMQQTQPKSITSYEDLYQSILESVESWRKASGYIEC